MQHDIRLQILAASRRTLGAEWLFPFMNDDFHRLYYVHSGTGRMQHHGESFCLSAGNMYLIPSGSPVDFLGADRMDISWVHFVAEIWGGFDLLRSVLCPYCLPALNERQVVVSFAQLIRNGQIDRYTESLLAQAGLTQLFALFIAQGKKTAGCSDDTLAYRRFAAVFQYIEAELSGSIRVADLAQRASLECAYFSEQWKRYFGMPPARYVRERRLAVARRLLRQSDAGLDVIASEVGFCDAFHLSKLFKKRYGLSPKDFRLQGLVP